MYNTKFFEKTAGFDRESFQNKLQEAIAIIAKNRSIVAKRVLKAIKEKKVSIHSFYDLTEEHYLDVKELLEKYNLFLPNKYPPELGSILRIEQELDGFMYNGRYIYIKSDDSVNEIASTIVHEVTHHFNKRLFKLDKKKGLTPYEYKDEVMAYTAEVIFQKNGACLLRSDVKKIHEFVNADYPNIAVKFTYAQLGYIPGFYDQLRIFEPAKQDNLLADVPEIKKPIEALEDYGPDEGLICVLF